MFLGMITTFSTCSYGWLEQFGHKNKDSSKKHYFHFTYVITHLPKHYLFGNSLIHNLSLFRDIW
jgi:hypothetical protein